MNPIPRLLLPLPALACVALMLAAADGGEAAPADTRPFIWVQNSEKAGILDKIANHAWASSVFNGMVARVAADVASHQSNRDAFLRELPVEWTLSPAKFKTIPTYAEASVRYAAEQKLNVGVDCAVLYYLTGDGKYASCAADILHNTVKTLLPVAASTSTANGGWIFQNDLLKEARVTGTQLPIVYDFLYPWLQGNQVHDVQTAGMVNFNFTNAQSYFRKYYQLTRDHGQKESNWSALMSTAMLNNLLALDDDSERAAAVQVYLATGSSRQASLNYDYRHYVQAGDIWPESLQYAAAVGNIRSTHMVLLERYDPSLDLFGSYPNLPTSLPRISQLRYPNGKQILFGDGTRNGTSGPFFIYELVYQHALARGRTDLASYFGSLINGGVAEGRYHRSTLNGYDNLGTQNDPLQLLWQAPVVSGPGVTPELPRTDRLPFAGVALQRNPAPANNTTYGLMCFVGGAGHIHSHASGMGMEIFGMGEVLGAKSGRSTYQSKLHENHYRLFASNNTVIVNGGSRGEGGWEGIGINTVQTVAMEPQPFATAVSPDFSFTCSSFADDGGTLAEATQQRTMAIVRTSPTSGFYVDLFRSKSTVTNRTATTLNGPVTDQYHDYIYRNIGETSVDMSTDGAPLPLVSQAKRFQNDIGDSYDQPGWRYFSNPVVSQPTSASFRARFVATVSGTPRYMAMHMPAVASREYVKVDSPAIVDAPTPYNTQNAPTVVVRQIGEAWAKAFATVYEPHLGSTGGTVGSVTSLLRGGVVTGVKIESTVGGNDLVHYVMANPNDDETYTDGSVGLSFTGRFGIAADLGDGKVTLYLGQGSSISYAGKSMATVSGSSSQAEVRFAPGEAPVIISNTPVNVEVSPTNASWIPITGGGFDWNHGPNWSSGVWPDETGAIAVMGNDISGDQAVNMNAPVKLGEIVVGDSDGGQSTLLQKGMAGSLTFDQPDSAMAYLTRTAGGTGTVTLAGDLDITLADDLTVRPADGMADSTIIIAGDLSGAGKSLIKEGGNLALVLSGDNTHSAATRITGGLLRADSTTALGNGNLALDGGGILGLGAGDLVNRTIGTSDNQLRWTGDGGFAAFGADRVVRFSPEPDSSSSSSINWTATNFIGSGRALVLGHETSDATIDWQHRISLAGTTRIIQVNDGAAVIDAKMSGIVAGGTSVNTNNRFHKTGPGTLAFTAQNSHWGNTIVSGGTLMIGDGGTTGGVSSNSSEIIVEAGATLAVNRSNTVTQGTSPFAAPITGDGGFAQVGTGNTVLTLANTYIGPTSIEAGTLTLGAAGVLPDGSAVVIANAALDSGSAAETAGRLDISGAAIIHLGAGASMAFADSSAVDWTGTLDLTGNFVPGTSLRFGTDSAGLDPSQLTLISADGFNHFALDAAGYLTAEASFGFDSWISGVFAKGSIPIDQRGPSDDFDKDKVANLLEFALAGHDPTVPDPKVGDFTGHTLAFAKRPGTSGLSYAIETSTDLGQTDPWAEVGGVSYVNDPDIISYALPGEPPRAFLRLRVAMD